MEKKGDNVLGALVIDTNSKLYLFILFCFCHLSALYLNKVLVNVSPTICN